MSASQGKAVVYKWEAVKFVPHTKASEPCMVSSLAYLFIGGGYDGSFTPI